MKRKIKKSLKLQLKNQYLKGWKLNIVIKLTLKIKKALFSFLDMASMLTLTWFNYLFTCFWWSPYSAFLSFTFTATTKLDSYNLMQATFLISFLLETWAGPQLFVNKKKLELLSNWFWAVQLVQSCCSPVSYLEPWIKISTSSIIAKNLKFGKTQTIVIIKTAQH